MEEGSSPPLLSISLAPSTGLEGNSDLHPRGQTGYKTVFTDTEAFFPFMCVTLNCHVYETLNPSSVGHVSFFCLLAFSRTSGWEWVGEGQAGLRLSLEALCDSLRSPQQPRISVSRQAFSSPIRRSVFPAATSSAGVQCAGAQHGSRQVHSMTAAASC